MPLVLREGYDAIAAAAVDAGCRFFAGYPMLPFTGLLEHVRARAAPRRRRVIQADTEIEGVNMALGAAATGARAATGSTGQGVALMQETIAEAALNELPLVVFNMARGQQDYFQARAAAVGATTAPSRWRPRACVEADELTRLAFELADKWLTPVDPLRRPHDRLHADDGRARSRRDVPRPPPDKPWALDGSSRRHRQVEGDLDLAAGQAQHARARARTGTGATSPPSTTRSRDVEARHAESPRRRRASISSCRSAPPARSSTTSSTSSAPRATRSARSARSRCGRSRATRSREPPPADCARCWSTSSTPGRWSTTCGSR